MGSEIFLSLQFLTAPLGAADNRAGMKHVVWNACKNKLPINQISTPPPAYILSSLRDFF